MEINLLQNIFLLSTLILVPFSASLYLFGLGLLYTSVALVSGSLMAIYHYKLMKNPNKRVAWKAYKVTAPYLVIIFISIALDSLWYIKL